MSNIVSFSEMRKKKAQNIQMFIDISFFPDELDVVQSALSNYEITCELWCKGDSLFVIDSILLDVEETELLDNNDEEGIFFLPIHIYETDYLLEAFASEAQINEVLGNKNAQKILFNIMSRIKEQMILYEPHMRLFRACSVDEKLEIIRAIYKKVQNMSK